MADSPDIMVRHYTELMVEREAASKLDFEFADDGQRCRIRMWGDAPWVFRWSDSLRGWIAERRASPNEVEKWSKQVATKGGRACDL